MCLVFRYPTTLPSTNSYLYYLLDYVSSIVYKVIDVEVSL